MPEELGQAVVSGLTRPRLLVSRGEHLFWVANDPEVPKPSLTAALSADAAGPGRQQIHRACLDGTDWRVLRRGLRSVNALHAADGELAWLDGESLEASCPGGEPCRSLGTFFGPEHLASNSRCWVIASGPNKAGLHAVPREGGPSQLLASLHEHVRALAVDEVHVYFYEDGAQVVRRVPVAGGAPQDVCTTERDVDVLAREGDDLWVGEKQHIRCVSAGDGRALREWSSRGSVTALALTEEWVVWIARGFEVIGGKAREAVGDALVRAPRGGGAAETLASADPAAEAAIAGQRAARSPARLVVRDGWAYFVDGSGGVARGSVRRVRLDGPAATRKSRTDKDTEGSSGDLAKVRRELYARLFGPLDTSVPVAPSLRGVWTGEIVQARLRGAKDVWVTATSGLTNADMPATPCAATVAACGDGAAGALTPGRGSVAKRPTADRPGLGYELFVVSRGRADWAPAVLAWLVQACASGKQDLLSAIEENGATTVGPCRLRDGRAPCFVVAPPNDAVPETLDLPAGSARLLALHAIERADVSFAMRDGPQKLLGRLRAGGLTDLRPSLEKAAPAAGKKRARPAAKKRRASPRHKRAKTRRAPKRGKRR